MYSTRETCRSARDRAASSLVGLVLLFGVVVAGAGIVFWAGMDAREDATAAAEVDTAETSLQEVSSELSTLAVAGSDATTEFDLSGKDANEVAVVRNGDVQFTVHGYSKSCSATVGLGSIVYEHDDGTQVAYQAGGVFKRADGASTIVEEPSVSYREEQLGGRQVKTVHFPVVNVSGDVSGSGTVTATASTADRGDLSNELCVGDDDSDVEWVRAVEITVEDSDYLDAWESHFEREFGESRVTRTGNAVSVRAPLGTGVAPRQFDLDDATIYGGMVMGSSAGNIDVQAGNPGQAEINSYDSSKGPYPDSQSSNGHVLTRGDVRIRANSGTIEGTVVAEGDVELQNSCGNGDDEYCVDGDVYHRGELDAPGSNTLVSGEKTNSADVPELDPMDDEIETALDVLEDDNHNDRDGVDAIDADANALNGGDQTLSSGVYYLEELTVADGDTLTLNVTSGDVVLAVEDDVTIDGDVRVEGAGQVRTFVGADSDHVTVGDDASVTVHEAESGDRTYRSNAFWVVCKAGCRATFEGDPGGTGAEFTGVVYGPGESGSVDLQRNSDVYGALVAGTVTFDKAYFHYDQGLPSPPVDVDGDGEADLGDGADGPDDGDGDDELECVVDDGTKDCRVEKTGTNALEVNQGSATITVIGSVVADERSNEVEVETTRPQNVELVIDDSGSMNLLENYGKWNDLDDDGDEEKTYTRVSGPHDLAGDAKSWSGKERVDDADYASSGWASPNGNEQWRVTDYDCDYACEPAGTEIVDAGESVYLADYDRVQRRTTNGGPDESTETYTVPEDADFVVVGDEDDDGAIETPVDAEEIYYPGETISGDDYAHYHEVAPKGNDPYFDRLEAAQAFVGSLDQPEIDNRIGLVRFDAYDDEVSGLTSDFDGINDSLQQGTFTSDGGTNLHDSLETAIATLDDGDEERGGEAVTDTIVLLTDGENSEYSDDAIEQLADEAHAENVSIYVIALGDDGDYDRELLEYIANEDGDPEARGKLYEVADVGDLEEKFEDAAEDSKTETSRIVQHRNTTTSVNVGGETVSFDVNTNDPDVTYPSKTIDAVLEPGDAVSFATTSYQCDGNVSFDETTSPDGETYEETYCANEDGEQSRTTNASASDHRIYMDGDPVDDVEADVWYKPDGEDSLREIVESYDESFVEDGTFDLPENDAIVLVRVDGTDGDDEDFTVLYFDASEYEPPEDDVGDGGDGASDSSGTENGYVVDVGATTVNVSSDLSPVAPPRFVAGLAGSGASGLDDAVAPRASPGSRAGRN